MPLSRSSCAHGALKTLPRPEEDAEARRTSFMSKSNCFGRPKEGEEPLT